MRDRARTRLRRARHVTFVAVAATSLGFTVLAARAFPGNAKTPPPAVASLVPTGAAPSHHRTPVRHHRHHRRHVATASASAPSSQAPASPAPAAPVQAAPVPQPQPQAAPPPTPAPAPTPTTQPPVASSGGS
ncbi:MAG: hypothetical protein QOC95_713 [Thermoleophilaceae bacterium]|nr:hypothetical protein [Thermoleophilaceae bacterium]